MTTEGFPSMPNELVLEIASYADDPSLLALLCNSSLHTLLIPLIHSRALAPRGHRSAIQWAATRGHVSLVKFLLARGVHPDTGASHGQPAALQAAVCHGRLDIVELLASHGADVNRQNFDRRSSFFAVIHLAAANGNTAMINLLAAHGASVVLENTMGMYVGTPLHFAVTASRLGAVQALLDLQGMVDEQDSGYETPLEVAETVACEDADTEEWWDTMVEIGKLLVKAGASIRRMEENLQDSCSHLVQKGYGEYRRIMIETRQDGTQGSGVEST